MKKLILTTFALIALVPSLALAQTYTVQPENSEVKWLATKVTGKHNGTIRVASGTIEFDGDQFTDGEGVIDTTSLTVDDLTGDGKGKLEGHLKSADFFDVDKFPSASIKITEVKPAGENLYDVTADLAIKGITHPIQFQVTAKKTDSGVSATTAIKVDRTKYDIRYGSGKFFENLGDKAIHDDFTLEISVKAV